MSHYPIKPAGGRGVHESMLDGENINLYIDDFNARLDDKYDYLEEASMERLTRAH